MTLGNGTTTSYGYSTQGALASLAHNLTGTAQDQTTTYTRNPVQEIVSQSWTNDLYQWTGYANGTQSYTANGLNQTTTAAGATLTHDARGNLTGDGVWTYAFDADNKLKSATKTGYAATLAYDAEGRLRRTTLAGAITDLAYDGVDLVAEYDGAGTLLRRYVHGPGVDEPLVWYEGSTTTAKSWLYADHLGSIIGTANSAGTSTAIHSYGPFGEPNVTTGVRFRYTGQQYLGGLNLYYYKARFYSPALGRFLQTDPIGTADDLNLYAYVGNNPVNFSDPTGLIAAEAQMLVGKVGATSEGQFALGFVPGYDLYSAYQNPNASMLDYGIGVLGVIPGMGKGAGLALKAGDNLVGAAARGVGEASSLANAARLRGQLAGKEIAGGHAFEKHVLNQGEFKGLGIRTREQFASHIENVVNNPTASRQLSGGRSAYWQDSTGTVVIRNPRAADGGTAFQPTNGRAYFDGLR